MSNGDPLHYISQSLDSLHKRFDKFEDRIDARLAITEDRIDSLEADRDRDYWPRRLGGLVVTVFLTSGLGAVIGMVVAR